MTGALYPDQLRGTTRWPPSYEQDDTGLLLSSLPHVRQDSKQEALAAECRRIVAGVRRLLNAVANAEMGNRNVTPTRVHASHGFGWPSDTTMTSITEDNVRDPIFVMGR